MPPFSAMLLLALFAVAAHAWSFTIARQPETCTSVLISWSDGVPPFTFTFLHPPDISSDVATNISDWSTGASEAYTFNQTMPLGADIIISSIEFRPLIVVGSDSTGFGSGGTSQVFDVLSLPGCALTPARNASDPSLLQSFAFSSVIACGTVTATHNGSLSGPINVDTIVPLGQSHRTTLNASVSNTLSWSLPVSAGTDVFFAFSKPDDPTGKSLVVTPFMAVSQGNGSCGASGTLSSATALPTGPVGSSALGRSEAPPAVLWAVGIAAFAALVFGTAGL
ncbi:hypothetical protein CALCODRAFT_499136 [Calocera cornea HHB12733]|uniref:Uncharacterized protein n=1 Tax=Calocera cornea HHB12733 TaxID=1353952 RepID=A0A165EIR8_9BASI|nr:hypothetical protein CALCODRAFT_499136 [Calocera cornea HHB12733]